MLIFLSLGSNLGNREATINQALDLLATQVGPLIKRSSFFYSQPWGFDSPNEFCNLCASFTTSLSPLDLLHTTQSIEKQLGRTQKSNGVYQDRTIDIDIIRAFDDNGNEIFFTHSTLHIPHIFWQQRDFVKVPLAEIMH